MNMALGILRLGLVRRVAFAVDQLAATCLAQTILAGVGLGLSTAFDARNVVSRPCQRNKGGEGCS